MTAKVFKDRFDTRYVFSTTDLETLSILKDHVFKGIYQCLLNQEQILEKLNEIERKQTQLTNEQN